MKQFFFCIYLVNQGWSFSKGIFLFYPVFIFWIKYSDGCEPSASCSRGEHGTNISFDSFKKERNKTIFVLFGEKGYKYLRITCSFNKLFPFLHFCSTTMYNYRQHSIIAMIIIVIIIELTHSNRAHC